jgi:hypothetical protein
MKFSKITGSDLNQAWLAKQGLSALNRKHDERGESRETERDDNDRADLTTSAPTR